MSMIPRQFRTVLCELRQNAGRDQKTMDTILSKGLLSPADYSEASRLACRIFSTTRTADMLKRWPTISAIEREKMLIANESVILDSYRWMFQANKQTPEYPPVRRVA